MIDYIIGSLILIVMASFVYVGAVISEENRQKKRIPLIWEKEFWK